MEHGLLIGEVAARSGVSRKAIRLYEARGILPPPRRTPAGYGATRPMSTVQLPVAVQYGSVTPNFWDIIPPTPAPLWR